MVGVPGRSKGCNTCIQRKIRCDQETPLCGNCRKFNRLCTGYKRRLGYVLSPNVSADLAAPDREDTTITYQGRWRRAKPQQSSHATYQAAEPPTILAENPPSLSLVRQVSASTALREQLHYLYLKQNMPAELLEHLPKDIVIRNWLLQLQEIAIQSPALEASIATFFAAQVGRKHNDLNLVHQSRSMYVHGLQRFQQALKNPRTRLSDETLAACMALSMYELTECPPGAQNTYMTHQKGAMMLLQLRGPEACASPLGQSLFLSLRTHTPEESVRIGVSVYRGETFLSHPEWIERPWKLLSKTPFDKLMDLLFEYHAAYQQYQEVENHETDQKVRQDGFRDVAAKCLKVDSGLRAFHGNFEKFVSGLLYWPEFSTLESSLDDAQLGRVFPVSFHFSVFFVAQVTVTYWTAMMAVHHLLMWTYNHLAGIESSTTLTSTTESLSTSDANDLHPAVPCDVRIREHTNTWRTMVRNICQSAEYFSKDDLGLSGHMVILTQLRGCKSCLENPVDSEDWTREIAWINEVIERIEKTVDFPVNHLFGG